MNFGADSLADGGAERPVPILHDVHPVCRSGEHAKHLKNKSQKARREAGSSSARLIYL